MAKDPACLFFIDKWFLATKEMKSDVRGWYLNLILHQFDKGDLPTDIEELANLADVRVTEFPKFQQVFEQVLQHKFQQNERGRLENDYAAQILKGREIFKEKRAAAGKLSAFVKYVRKHLCQDENAIHYIKQNVDLTNVDLNNQQVLKQVFEQMFQLFINVNVNANINGKVDGVTGEDETPVIDEAAIIPRMFTAWKQIKPKYIARPSDDLPALAAILKIILKEQKLSLYKLGDADQALCIWLDVANFIHSDPHFSTYQLTQVNKYFASIASKYVAATEGVSNQSTIKNNIQTAQGAANKLKERYQSETV